MKPNDMRKLAAIWLAVVGRDKENESTAFAEIFGQADPATLRVALDAYRAESPDFPKIQALEAHYRRAKGFMLTPSVGAEEWERDLFAKRLTTMPDYGWRLADSCTVPNWQIGKWFGQWLDHRNPEHLDPTARQVELEAKLAAAGWVCEPGGSQHSRAWLSERAPAEARRG